MTIDAVVALCTVNIAIKDRGVLPPRAIRAATLVAGFINRAPIRYLGQVYQSS